MPLLYLQSTPFLKKFFIILLTLVSITASLGDSFILLVFNLNQPYIAKNLCIQKEVENNTCQGCCQLKKQMENHNEQDNTSPNPSKRKLHIDFYTPFDSSYKPLYTSKSISYYIKHHLSIQTFLSDIFHPPQT